MHWHILIGIVTLATSFSVLEVWFSYQRSLFGDQSSDPDIFDAIYPMAAPNIIALKENYEALWSTPEFSVKITTDAHGFRIPTSSNAEDAELIVMGDSFTFGHGVEGSERYGNVLGALANKKTLVVSYNNGWAPPHYLRYFDLNRSLRPKIVVIGLYLGNDFYSDMRETVFLEENPSDFILPLRIVDAHGRLVNRATLANRWLELVRSQSSFGRWVLNALVRGGFVAPPAFLLNSGAEAATAPNSLNPEALDRGESVAEFERSFSFVKQLEMTCKSRNENCQLEVLLIPQNFLVYEAAVPHTNLQEIDQAAMRHGARSLMTLSVERCSALGIKCINPVAALMFESERGNAVYFNRDGHWNALGHKVAAEELCSKSDWCTGR